MVIPPAKVQKRSEKKEAKNEYFVVRAHKQLIYVKNSGFLCNFKTESIA